MPIAISVREAFHELLRNDPGIVALLGESAPGSGTARGISWGWIEAESQPGSFPRITYYMTGDDLIGEDHANAELLATIWTWRDIGRAEAIDRRLQELCNGDRRSFNGVPIWYRLGAARDYPDEPDAPVRIARPVIMGV